MGRANHGTWLSGRVGKTPEMVFTPEGRAKVTFSVAVNAGYSKEGEWVDKTVWYNLISWGSTAEYINRTIGRGDLVTVLAQYDTYSYERDGETRYGHSFTVSNIDRLLKNPNRADEPDAEFQAAQFGADDDIPF